MSVHQQYDVSLSNLITSGMPLNEALQKILDDKHTNIDASDVSGLEDKHLQFFTNAVVLNIEKCNEINGSGFGHLGNLRWLNMRALWDSHITNETFRHLPNLEYLDMGFCNAKKTLRLTNDMFQYLPKLKVLDIFACTHLTKQIFEYLPNLQKVFIDGCVNLQTPEIIRKLWASQIEVKGINIGCHF